jgi:hypothetical protein
MRDGESWLWKKLGTTPWSKRTQGLSTCSWPTPWSRVDSDSSISSKNEFLASIKSPDYQPSQAVTEQTAVQVYGDAAVVVGIFRVKGTEKGKPLYSGNDLWIRGSKPTALGSAWQPLA